jgi:hypothetical protein
MQDADDLLTMRFVIGIEGTTVTGLVFVFDVVAALRRRPHGQQHRQADINFCECFHAALL